MLKAKLKRKYITMKSLKKNQLGFSAIEVILVLILVGLVGFVGWYVWHNKTTKVSSSTSTPALAKTTTPTTTKPTTPKTDPNAGYLVIAEWGAKVKMADADKVTYKYDASNKGKEDSQTGGTIDSNISLVVKPSLLHDKTCDVSIGYTRYSKLTDSFFIQRSTRIGDYYYMSGGSPYTCTNSDDNALAVKVRAEFGNIQAL